MRNFAATQNLSMDLEPQKIKNKKIRASTSKEPVAKPTGGGKLLRRR
jgi:hypothetical protein